MPELILVVKWPDEEVQKLYSPSTIIREYFKVGDKITINKFLSKSTKAFNHASQRVMEVHGFYCTASTASINAIQQKKDEMTDMESYIEIIDIC